MEQLSRLDEIGLFYWLILMYFLKQQNFYFSKSTSIGCVSSGLLLLSGICLGFAEIPLALIKSFILTKIFLLSFEDFLKSSCRENKGMLIIFNQIFDLNQLSGVGNSPLYHAIISPNENNLGLDEVLWSHKIFQKISIIVDVERITFGWKFEKNPGLFREIRQTFVAGKKHLSDLHVIKATSCIEDNCSCCRNLVDACRDVHKSWLPIYRWVISLSVYNCRKDVNCVGWAPSECSLITVVFDNRGSRKLKATHPKYISILKLLICGLIKRQINSKNIHNFFIVHDSALTFQKSTQIVREVEC